MLTAIPISNYAAICLLGTISIFTFDGQTNTYMMISFRKFVRLSAGCVAPKNSTITPTVEGAAYCNLR